MVWIESNSSDTIIRSCTKRHFLGGAHIHETKPAERNAYIHKCRQSTTMGPRNQGLWCAKYLFLIVFSFLAKYQTNYEVPIKDYWLMSRKPVNAIRCGRTSMTGSGAFTNWEWIGAELKSINMSKILLLSRCYFRSLLLYFVLFTDAGHFNQFTGSYCTLKFSKDLALQFPSIFWRKHT